MASLVLSRMVRDEEGQRHVRVRVWSAKESVCDRIRLRREPHQRRDEQALSCLLAFLCECAGVYL